MSLLRVSALRDSPVQPRLLPLPLPLPQPLLLQTLLDRSNRLLDSPVRQTLVESPAKLALVEIPLVVAAQMTKTAKHKVEVEAIVMVETTKLRLSS
jgi:hypothetical protein